MICSPCGSDNAAPRRFCGQCGAHLYNACAHCGFENLAVDRFCGGCGDPLAQERVLRAARPAVTAAPAVRAVPAPPVAVKPAAAPPRSPAAAVAAAPAAPAPATSKPAGRNDDLLSSSELSDLLRKPAAAPAAVASPSVEIPDGAITQDTLDQLFGG
jgi:hypothetical protein